MAKKKTLEERFEKQAAFIRRYLRGDKRYDPEFHPRPFFIEFTGSPDAGKSTTIEKLYNDLRRFGLRVWIPQEGAQVIQHVPRDTYEYNIRTGLYALSLLIDESHWHKYDVVILDRGIYDAYVWMLYWHQKGQLTEVQMKEKQNFFMDPLWRNRVDVVYFVTCDPEVALNRDQEYSATSKFGQSTNPESLGKSVDRHVRAFQELKPTTPNLFHIDTSALDRGAMVELFTYTTLDILEAKVKEKKN